jgi:hypothetical protein
MADTLLSREISMINDPARVNLALNPATAMRGSFPVSDAAPMLAKAAEIEYASPEMQAYLAPPPEATPPAVECLETVEDAR